MGFKRFFSILILLMMITCAFAAESGNIQFRYKINKYVAEHVDPGFVDTSMRPISTYEIDLSKHLDYTQVYLAVTTNATSDYALTLKFFPMKNNDPQDASFVGCYKVMVFDTDFVALETNAPDSTLLVNDTNGCAITFDGANVQNASKQETFYFPITFDFANYIEDYAVGTFTGSILVEVTTQ